MPRSVFGFLAKKSDQAEIAGPAHILRLPRFSDYRQWYELRSESRAFLQPWEPLWGRDDLSESSFRARVMRNEQEYSSGVAVPLLIFERASDTLLGGLTIGHIRRGAAQSCMIGYWMGARHAGQGHMRKALDLSVHHIFTRLSLHRVEAACIADNHKSIRLLEGAGFGLEGQMKEFLKINGVWRDHLLYARINGAAEKYGKSEY
jgi:[ribosomal protein S5]-alanine N-acetyltransferase